MYRPLYTVLVSVTMLMGCGTSSRLDRTPESLSHRSSVSDSMSVHTIDNLLRNQAQNWMGTPHILGGNSEFGIDCSALVQSIYRESFLMELPRTTIQQVRLGRRVSSNEAQPGDLVFYRIDLQTRHVGIYLSDNEFLHASKSEGVTISRLDLPYWQDRLWTIRRILEPMPDSSEDEVKTRTSW